MIGLAWVFALGALSSVSLALVFAGLIRVACEQRRVLLPGTSVHLHDGQTALITRRSVSEGRVYYQVPDASQPDGKREYCAPVADFAASVLEGERVAAEARRRSAEQGALALAEQHERCTQWAIVPASLARQMRERVTQ